MLLDTRQLEQFTIGATDGDIGRVTDVYFDDRQWTVRYFVVKTGGWLSGREVLISPVQLRRADTTHGVLRTSLTRVEVEGSPPVDAKKPVSRQDEAAYSRYYGVAPSWAGPVVDPWPVPAAGRTLGSQPSTAEEEILARERSQQDPHLRSAAETRGYSIEARGGSIGHVEDFLVDERSWAIRWMIVDTRNWWPGKHVLVSPEWIDRVSWDESAVLVDFPRDQIQAAPEYDANLPVDRELESRLAAHYGRRGYWEREERAA